MKEKNEPSRRNFLKKLGTATAAVAVGQNVFAADKKNEVFAYLKRPAGISANDQVNIALIGAGGQRRADRCQAMRRYRRE